MSALDALAGWPVGAAAGAVLDSGGVLARHGDADRRFPLASVTKLLAARAVQVAVEEGAVDLDTAAGPPGSTVRHLLAHASGLAMTSAQVMAAPGTRRIYSNEGFAVLARTVHDASGIAFADYLAEAVGQPLGMTHTDLDGGDGAAGYGAVSTITDLVPFAVDLLAPRLVSREMAESATSVQFPGLSGVLPGFGAQRPNDWGLGFELRDGKAPHWTGSGNSAGTFGHFGQSGTFLWVDPVAGLACVVLTDRDFGDWALRRWPALSDEVLREFAD